MKLRKLAKLKYLFSSRRLRSLRRSPKIFIPTPHRWIVIPYRPLGVLVILLLIACSVYLLLRSDIFLVRHLRFVNEGGQVVSVLSEDDLKAVLMPYVTHSIFFIRVQDLTEELRHKFLALKKVRVSKKYPDELIVYWEERQPVAVIDQSGQKLLVDGEGLLYAQITETEKLPQIHGFAEEELGVGERLKGPRLGDILTILGRLSDENQIKVQRVTLVTGEILEVDSEEGWKVLFSLRKDVEKQLYSLLAIVSKYKREGNSFSEVDLRFKFPVIR